MFLLSFWLLFKIIPTASSGYGFLILIVINRTGCVNYCLTIIHYMLGSNQATRLPNRKQGSGSKMGKQTLLFLSAYSLRLAQERILRDPSFGKEKTKYILYVWSSPQNYVWVQYKSFSPSSSFMIDPLATTAWIGPNSRLRTSERHKWYVSKIELIRRWSRSSLFVLDP